MYVCMCECMYSVYNYMYICMYVCMYVFIVCMYICTYACMYLSILYTISPSFIFKHLAKSGSISRNSYDSKPLDFLSLLDGSAGRVEKLVINLKPSGNITQTRYKLSCEIYNKTFCKTVYIIIRVFESMGQIGSTMVSVCAIWNTS